MTSIHSHSVPRRFSLLAGAVSLAVLLVAVPAHGAEVHLAGLEQAASHQRFIVRYRQAGDTAETGAALRRSLSSAAASLPAGGGLAANATVQRLAVGAELLRLGKPLGRADSERLMRRLAMDPAIAHVEVDRRLRLHAVPDDPRFADQWAYTGNYGIRAPQAWDHADGAGIVVAVLDTGVAAHSDLDANLLAGHDFISDPAMANDGDGRDGDARDPGDWVAANQCGGSHPAQASSWHGTHVAGTVAALSNNARGVAGTAPAARVVPVRVLGRCGGYLSDIADAIVWAAGGVVADAPANPHPAEVINLSLGGSGACGPTFQEAINSAVARGTTVVVAAGNDNVNVANAAPANCANVIAVGASDSAGKRAIWSSSQQSNFGPAVDMAAPGSNIVSTLNSGRKEPSVESYGYYGGTSMAAPHVAGVVALVQQVSDTVLTPAQVKALLKQTATAFPAVPDREIGVGIVNAHAAVAMAMGEAPPPAPEPEPDAVLTNGVALTGLAGSKGRNRYYTVQLPNGASNLLISISGGSGDADLYVRAGTRPTSSAFDCRPFRGGNGESCSFPTPVPGLYHVMLTAYGSYAGLSLKASWGLVPAQTYRSGEGVDIADNATVESRIEVSGRSANAPAATPVNVDISHGWRGDLKVELVAPDGSAYLLSNYEGGSADDIKQTFEVDLSREALNGSWTLRVHDKASGDTGRLNGWSITF